MEKFRGVFVNSRGRNINKIKPRGLNVKVTKQLISRIYGIIFLKTNRWNRSMDRGLGPRGRRTAPRLHH
jgi:hypothetical protein